VDPRKGLEQFRQITYRLVRVAHLTRAGHGSWRLPLLQSEVARVRLLLLVMASEFERAYGVPVREYESLISESLPDASIWYLACELHVALSEWLPRHEYLIAGGYEPESLERDARKLTRPLEQAEVAPLPRPPLIFTRTIQPNAPNSL